MDAKYYSDRIAALEKEKQQLMNEAGNRLSFIEGQIQILQEMKTDNDETIKRLEEDNRVLREMADKTLGGRSNGTFVPAADLYLVEPEEG